jgi:hypothetical protein
LGLSPSQHDPHQQQPPQHPPKKKKRKIKSIREVDYLKYWVTKSDLPEFFLIRIFGNVSNIDQKSFKGPLNCGALILDQGKGKRREKVWERGQATQKVTCKIQKLMI